MSHKLRSRINLASRSEIQNDGGGGWLLLRDPDNYGINQSKTKNINSVIGRLELSILFI